MIFEPERFVRMFAQFASETQSLLRNSATVARIVSRMGPKRGLSRKVVHQLSGGLRPAARRHVNACRTETAGWGRRSGTSYPESVAQTPVHNLATDHGL